MSNDNTAVPNSLQEFSNCPDWGKGGRFVFDPATGKRSRVADATEDNQDGAAVVGDAIETHTEAESQPASTAKKEKARG